MLRHDPQADLVLQAGAEPGPLDEVKMWEKHLGRLRSIDEQLDSDVAKDILHNLEQADSQYAHSFQSVRKDINKVGYFVVDVVVIVVAVVDVFVLCVCGIV